MHYAAIRFASRSLQKWHAVPSIRDPAGKTPQLSPATRFLEGRNICVMADSNRRDERSTGKWQLNNFPQY